jgi:hypothetical protein
LVGGEFVELIHKEALHCNASLSIVENIIICR